MACGSPIAPNASHAALRTSQASSCRACEKGWDGLRVAYRPQRLTRRLANLPSLILQGLEKGRDGLRVAYRPQRPTRRLANPTKPHP
jgi:hypothetical protein